MGSGGSLLASSESRAWAPAISPSSISASAVVSGSPASSIGPSRRSRKPLISLSGSAPTNPSTGRPRWKATTAGMDLIPSWSAIVGSSSGNLVEWYDFYCYAFFALYFAPAFFPKGDSTSQLLQTAGIFAVGFFMDVAMKIFYIVGVNGEVHGD